MLRRLAVTVIDRGKDTGRALEVAVSIFSTRGDRLGQLPFGGDELRATALDDRQRGVAGANRRADACARIVGQILRLFLEGEIDATLRLGDPPPSTLVERRIPFVPRAAAVIELQAADQRQV